MCFYAADETVHYLVYKHTMCGNNYLAMSICLGMATQVFQGASCNWMVGERGMN